MQNNRISQEKIQYLASEIQSNIPHNSIQRGMQYFRKGRVVSIEATESEICAAVQGTYKYLVQINLKNFQLSRCSCPVTMNCKHMAAVFFYLEDNVKSHLTPPKSTDSLDNWYLYLSEAFQQFGKNYHYVYTYGYYENFLDGLVQIVWDWPSPAKDLFLFHGCIFTMNKFENFKLRQQYNYHRPLVTTNFSEMFVDMLRDTAKNIALNLVLEKNSLHLASAIEKIRDNILQDNYVYFDWLLIYRQLWSESFANNDFFEIEIEKLEKLYNRTNISPATKYNLAVAMSHLFFLTADDQRAMKILDRADLRIKDILLYLDSFSQSRDWERMEKWLQWLRPKMIMASSKDIGEVSNYWLELAKERNNYDQVLVMLKSWLPKSNYSYEAALLMAGHYQTWVEYHIFNQNQPMDLDRDDLKQVESYDPTLLLPLYHQSVINLIENKNRNSYKNAVRLLKKLKTYYKKLKQVNVWDNYISTLSSHYSRLRALQEEMRKGNLIA